MQLVAKLLVVVGLLISCSDSNDPNPTDSGIPNTSADTNTNDASDNDIGSQEAIVALISDDDYQSWRCELEPRPSIVGSGHHDKARVCFNPTLEISLQADNNSHPQGSIAVKELYDSGDVLLGHAVMVKDMPGNDEQSWIWYEALAPDYDEPWAYGRAASGCFVCHSGGQDFIHTPLPD